MELNLKNPIIFFDLETTGTNPAKDRIVEMSYLKVYPNGREESKTLRINPEMHIAQEASAVNGITDDDVKDCPTFKQVATEIAADFKGCDIAGYNSNKFDLPLLAEEFERAHIDIDMKKHKFVDVQGVFFKKEPRTLVAAYRFYCDKDLTNAHSADADTRATYEVLKAQLDRYPDLENSIEFLSGYTAQTRNVDYAGVIIYNEKGEEVFNIGKHKGRLVEDVLRAEPSYYDWMMKADFTLYTKKVLTNIRLRMKK